MDKHGIYNFQNNHLQPKLMEQKQCTFYATMPPPVFGYYNDSMEHNYNSRSITPEFLQYHPSTNGGRFFAPSVSRPHIGGTGEFGPSYQIQQQNLRSISVNEKMNNLKLYNSAQLPNSEYYYKSSKFEPPVLPTIIDPRLMPPPLPSPYLHSNISMYPPRPFNTMRPLQPQSSTWNLTQSHTREIPQKRLWSNGYYDKNCYPTQNRYSEYARSSFQEGFDNSEIREYLDDKFYDLQSFENTFGDSKISLSLHSSDLFLQQKFQQQLNKFPNLPPDAHRKINTMGNEITGYFQAKMTRFYDKHVLESVNSHIVFTSKLETGQNFVMAFSQEKQRILVKYNRLLTHHLKVQILSTTAVEMNTAKAQDVEESFVFHFHSEIESQEFLHLLRIHQQAPWNHKRLGTELKMKQMQIKLREDSTIDNFHLISPIRPEKRGTLPSMSDQDSNWRSPVAPVDSLPKAMTSSPSPVRKMSRSSDDEFVYDSTTFSNALKMVNNGYLNGVECTNNTGEVDTACVTDILKLECPLSPIPMQEQDGLLFGSAMFQADDLTLFLKEAATSDKYISLGIGKLCIFYRGTRDYDVLLFLNQRKDDVCRHHIYGWNSVNKEVQDGENIICKWKAAAELLNAPTDVPSVREFKVVFSDKSMGFSFFTAMETAIQKACNPLLKKIIRVPTKQLYYTHQ